MVPRGSAASSAFDDSENKTVKQLLQVIALCALGGLSPPALAQVGAQVKAADARVEKLLMEADLKYQVDEDGDFRLEFGLDDDRSQLVWIASRTSQYETLEVREVWAIAYRSKEPLSAEVANKVLLKNNEMIVGAWQLKKWGEDFVLAYAAQVAASTDAVSLRYAMEAVIVTADELEKELTGADEF